MAELKTKPTKESVDAFLNKIPDPERRADCFAVAKIMEEISGEKPKMWGPSIVGFGSYHYRYASGREGDAPAASFAPRKSALSVYVMDGVDAYADLLTRLGRHRTGVACLYLTDLEQNDLRALEEIVARSYATLTAGTYGRRARDGVGQAGIEPATEGL